eukprot:Colp12_sorted_trinity150504_noHs@2699
MDRFVSLQFDNIGRPILTEGEVELRVQAHVGLYNGENKTDYNNGTVTVTNMRILWSDHSTKTGLALSLELVYGISFHAGFLASSPKVKITLKSRTDTTNPPLIASKESFIKLSFRKGGAQECFEKLQAALKGRAWIKAAPKASLQQAPAEFTTRTAGISGILRTVEQNKMEADKNINEAFQDLNALMTKAKEMVQLAEQFTAKIKKASGDVSEDEASQFKAYLLSMGIDNPVTRRTYGSGDLYHRELSRQLAGFLQRPLEKEGGMMQLVDVYCLYNRARGTELVSPDDMLRACELFEPLGLPLRMKIFASGVIVVQLLSLNNEEICKKIEQLLVENATLTAVVLSNIFKISITLALQHLLTAEQAGVLCRDETVEGVVFYPNLFKEVVLRG